jgi:ATP-dependent protease ClpP protease subunit
MVNRRTISQRSELVNDCHNFGLLIDTREIFLCSDLEDSHEEAMIDHRAANQFIRNLRILQGLSKQNILVHQITTGGEWPWGMAIFDAIKASCDDPESADIILLAHGQATSMSSIIPQAAKYRVIMPNADFLIHWGSAYLEGSHSTVMAEADWCKKVSDKMVEIYLNRCHTAPYWKKKGMKTPQAVADYIRENMDKKQEWYLTPREAVEMGFMDAVWGDSGYETMEMMRIPYEDD